MCCVQDDVNFEVEDDDDLLHASAKSLPSIQDMQTKLTVQELQLRLDIGVRQVINHHFRTDLNNYDRHCILLFSTRSPLQN